MSHPFLFSLHKYVALGLGAFIAMMGLTGTTLVFREELDHGLHPERQVAVDARGPQWDLVFKSAVKAVPEARVFTIKGGAPDRAYEVYAEAERSRRLWVDPYSGRIVTDSREPGTPSVILFRLHTELLSGNIGTGIVAAVGIALILLSVTGAILWWPRSLADGFRIRWGGKPLAVNYDVHRVWGAIFAVLLLTNAVTGILLLFSTTAGNTANRLFGGSLPSTRLAEPAASREFRSIDELVAVANNALPEGYVTRVRVAWPSGLVIVQKRVPASEHHPNGLNRVFVNPYTAEVADVVPAATAPPAVKLFAWVYPWHTGQYFGVAHRILWVFLGLTPLLMFVTGLTLWLGRRRRKQRGAQRVVTAAAQAQRQ